MSSHWAALRSAGYDRIYFYHIRRVGGTSLNETFFQLHSAFPGTASEVVRASKDKIICLDGVRYVGANRGELIAGAYFYGFSHFPSHTLKLPSNTFTVTIFRDPFERIMSHYRMVNRLVADGSNRPWLALERSWLGNNIVEFSNNMPKERLFAQLYMFSDRCRVSEALAGARRCSKYFFNDNYDVGIADLGRELALPLAPRHSHAMAFETQIASDLRAELKQILTPEYEMLDCLRSRG